MQVVERSLHAREQQQDVGGNEVLRARQGSAEQTEGLVEQTQGLIEQTQGLIEQTQGLVEQTFRRI